MARERITSAFATAERTAEVLGVSPARTRRLVTLAQEDLGTEHRAKSKRRPHVSTNGTEARARKASKKR